jgi:hypothetical protein
MAVLQVLVAVLVYMVKVLTALELIIIKVQAVQVAQAVQMVEAMVVLLEETTVAEVVAAHKIVGVPDLTLDLAVAEQYD